MELSTAQLAALELPAPPLDEQRRIASFLDCETARIDTLIEEQQLLVTLLRERRKAVVEQAVFCGVDEFPMTNNADPWLPPTPSHWTIVQLGFISDTVAGYAFPSDEFSANTEHIRLLRGVNVKPGRLDWTDAAFWDLDTAPIPSDFVLEAGDLAFGMDRPFVGNGVRVATVSEADLPAVLLQRVMRIRLGGGTEQAYLSFLMSTDSFLNYLEPLFTGVSVPHVSERQVRKFRMPLPPLQEQERIVAFLDEQSTKLNLLIAETEQFIDLARERRAAVIAAAVTGQIDARETA